MRARVLDQSVDLSAAARPSVGQARVRLRFVGYLAGLLFSLGALSALATMPLLTDPRLPASFELVIALTLVSGTPGALIPWNVLSPRWLHAVQIIVMIEVALAVWTAGPHGSIHGIYYVFVALSRRTRSNRRGRSLHTSRSPPPRGLCRCSRCGHGAVTSPQRPCWRW
jgi:hypothetical protein